MVPKHHVPDDNLIEPGKMQPNLKLVQLAAPCSRLLLLVHPELHLKLQVAQPPSEAETAGVQKVIGGGAGSYEPCVPVEERVASEAKVASASIPVALMVTPPVA